MSTVTATERQFSIWHCPGPRRPWADVVAAWVKAAMAEAMAPLLDPVPVEIEVKAASGR